MVGELHSLTDWHVSEASDDAELDDFYSTKKGENILLFVFFYHYFSHVAFVLRACTS